MNVDQAVVFTSLALLLVLFIWGRWRYDLSALFILLALTIYGLVPPEEAFSGFGHPAVITVAAVLIVSRALFNSGLVDHVVRLLSDTGKQPAGQMTILVVTVTLCSAFMNNIGALALFMPVAIRMARRSGTSPSLFLMPLAFGSLLGGLMTQVGTPPNIIVSIFRADIAANGAFRMFDFTPVGAAVAAAGVIFIVTVGWRLVPDRRSRASEEDLLDIESYVTTLEVPEKSALTGKRVKDLEEATAGDVMVVGHTRGDEKYAAPSAHRTFKAGDQLVIKAAAEDLQDLVDATGLKLSAAQKTSAEELSSDQVAVMEATLTRNSPMEGRTVRGLQLRSRYGVNLLGLSRQGGRLRSGPDAIRLRAGDVLLLQGPREILQEVLPDLGLLPLVERGLRVGRPRRVLFGLLIFSVSVVLAASGRLPVQIAFSGAALLMVLFGFLSLREIYNSIDWPVIVLLGAMIPVSQTLQTTGGAGLIADRILLAAGGDSPWVILVVVLLGTMFLSDLVNNAAAALLMAPIAINVAGSSGVSADPFLMAVAIGASCAFLTPIGHQSNALVMGPGGYRFGDYWRMGLPLEVLITLVATPLILLVWPL